MDRLLFAVLGAAALALCGAAMGLTQPQKPPPTDVPALLAKVSAADGPVKEHEVLKALEGAWKIRATVTMPGAPPFDATGTAENQVVLGGRFVRCQSSTAAGDVLRTQTIEMYGYDRAAGTYTLVGFDTMGTSYVTATGTYDEGERTLRLKGLMGDKAQPQAFKWEVRFDSPARLVQRVLVEMQPGEWSLIAELEYVK